MILPLFYSQLALIRVQTILTIVTALSQLNPFCNTPRPSIILDNLLVTVLVTVFCVFYLRMTKIFITVQTRARRNH
jgi:hypothetical protein